MLKKVLVDVLDDRIDAVVLVVDEQARVRFARRGPAEALVEAHRDALAHHRGVLPVVVEDDGAETGEALAIAIAIELDLQSRLRAAPRTEAARADADVAHRVAAPDELRGIVTVPIEPLTQRSPVTRVDAQMDIVQRRVVEQIAWTLRETRRDARQRHEQRRNVPT